MNEGGSREGPGRETSQSWGVMGELGVGRKTLQEQGEALEGSRGDEIAMGDKIVKDESVKDEFVKEINTR